MASRYGTLQLYSIASTHSISTSIATVCYGNENHKTFGISNKQHSGTTVIYYAGIIGSEKN